MISRKVLTAGGMALAFAASSAFAEEGVKSDSVQPTSEQKVADSASAESKVKEWDSDGDGKVDAWDTNDDGKPDAWDTDGDGKPDKTDANGDGQPD